MPVPPTPLTAARCPASPRAPSPAPFPRALVLAVALPTVLALAGAALIVCCPSTWEPTAHATRHGARGPGA